MVWEMPTVKAMQGRQAARLVEVVVVVIRQTIPTSLLAVLVPLVVLGIVV